ncbi:polar amino acid transport system permease protein/polar amino acid transport system substrate-binding protein [Thermosporothrix hazakensis]|jgi:His/Glu/Gln/Arg/opine family amino acid ABC transporter permease subunit|uniref:Polar amino acid transport system permease protein/polar amino acid transport system substrate-binding protein n=2 Tax=Thermosporothrix TaxID=768650 RepID=A0A326UBN7_THEHA|nr:amino acid ABC transporter permease [Thermosporothrix hazakensis]PZW22476.1 polar amino acid transport system permease protein/polar amino acid transport system substrate-binding protein [Thermosporothrix hazakensis]BBH86042.1 hypothetical protein KTC_07930 [Thermosporothrix sp. COM3]GCE45533.1 hypothetical protein KTH_04020 [Thermosporothrix hazakensis]
MDLALQALPAFLAGARDTVIYCVTAFPLALVLGLVLALMRNARTVWLHGPARIFIEVIRGTPILVQLYILYYALGAILAQYHLANMINAWSAGIAALALNYAAYEAEIFRAGLASVEQGQTEAAYSLGLSRAQNFFRIVLPQAIPLMIPPFVNDFIFMIKDSAIVSLVSGTDLTSILSFWVTRHGSNPLPLYALAIVLYLAMSLPTSFVARKLEARVRASLQF